MGPKLVQGALNWIRHSYPKAFADETERAAAAALRTGNEHAVTLTERGNTLPFAAGERYEVQPRWPVRRSGIMTTEDPYAINALLHTHPIDDAQITTAPSSMDLELPFFNRSNKPIRHTIISPENETFVDYTRQRMYPSDEATRLFQRLQKHTNSDINGVEPIQNDVNLAILRRMAEQNQATLEHQLGPEQPYFDEIYKMLRNRLGLKRGGLAQVKECNCGG